MSEVPDIHAEFENSKWEIVALLKHALQNSADGLEIIPINYTVSEIARKNDKRPAYLQVYVPDSWALNLAKNQALLDGYIAIRIPREDVDKFVKWSEENKD